MMTVNELAKQAGVRPHVVRYYTSVGLLEADREPRNRYRKYRHRDVARLRFIRHAKLLGFTLGDIKEILRDADNHRSPCPRARELIVKRLAENQARLDELVTLQARMSSAVKTWRSLPDGMPDGDRICHLIESVTEEGTDP